MWKLNKSDRNELTYKTETDSEIQRTEFMVAGGWEGMGQRDGQGVRDRRAHNAVFKMDNQQEPTIQHR